MKFLIAAACGQLRLKQETAVRHRLTRRTAGLQPASVGDGFIPENRIDSQPGPS
jgi:hypothetical protein